MKKYVYFSDVQAKRREKEFFMELMNAENKRMRDDRWRIVNERVECITKEEVRADMKRMKRMKNRKDQITYLWTDSGLFDWIV